MAWTSCPELKTTKSRPTRISTNAMKKLGKHERTQQGTFRRERSDTLVKTLKEEYPEFKDVNGNTKLGTLKEKFGVDSLNEVRHALRKQRRSSS